MVHKLTVQDVTALANRLEKIAKEVEDTAEGSSRKDMYHALASEIRRDVKFLRDSLR